MPNLLVRDEGPTIDVRMRPGWFLRAFDDLAPSVPVAYGPGETLTLPAVEAGYQVAIGAVEII